MSSAAKAEILKTLEMQVRAKRENKLKSFIPYPKQREFIASTALPHTECALQCNNQFGKSTTAAYMAAIHATGLYPNDWPGRVFDKPNSGWVCSESAISTRDTAQALLCGPPNDDENYGTGFIPKSTLLSKALSHGASGAFDSIRVRHVSGGVSTIGFKSYEQAVGKFQSKTLEWCWMDEEPELDLYTECLARLIATNGLMFSTYTPLHGTGRIVLRFSEGIPSRSIVRATMDDAPHLADPVRREQLLSTFPSYQRGARLRGEPMLGSGRVFETPIEDLLVPLRITPKGEVFHETIGQLDTRAWRLMWSVDFGISHPFAATLLAHDADHDCIYLLAELRLANTVPAIHASRMRSLYSPPIKVIWPHDGAQREKSSGVALADIYRGEGLMMNDTWATFEKGGYSTEAGVLDMDARMQSGRFKVARGCTIFQEEYAMYHRKNGLIVKQFDDVLSACRIGVMSIRSARPLAPRRDRGRTGDSTKYPGYDPDPFTGR